MKRTLFLGMLLTFLFISQRVLGQSFSVDSIGLTVQKHGGFADDIYLPTPGVPPVLPAPLLGFPGAGLQMIENDGFSYGRPLSDFSKTAPAYFSVNLGAFGAAGTAVSVEFNAAGGSEASSDIFYSNYGGGNSLQFDGDGLATAPNPAAPPLGTGEATSYGPPTPPIPPVLADDVDGLDMRSIVLGPVQPGSPTGVIFFSVLNAGSYGYAPGTGAADVFVAPGTGGYSLPLAVNAPPASPAGVPQPYASEIALGFAPPILGNDIDALVVFDNGDNMYQPGIDIVLFSLRTNSPYLGTMDPILNIPIGPGDILIDGTNAMLLLGSPLPQPAILHRAETLGLVSSRSGVPQDDELNALDVFVPEPTSGALAFLGVVGLLIALRRRPR